MKRWKIKKEKRKAEFNQIRLEQFGIIVRYAREHPVNNKLCFQLLNGVWFFSLASQVKKKAAGVWSRSAAAECFTAAPSVTGAYDAAGHFMRHGR